MTLFTLNENEVGKGENLLSCSSWNPLSSCEGNGYVKEREKGSKPTRQNERWDETEAAAAMTFAENLFYKSAWIKAASKKKGMAIEEL